MDEELILPGSPGWDLSCPDWADRLRRGKSLVPPNLPLNLVAGERAVAVFNKLRLADVPGTPTMAEAGGDWFRDIVRALWGALDPITRARAIRELFLLVPKKNSKTTNGALLMLTALLLNERPNASLIMTAPVHDVAQLAFDAARGAIELDDVLSKKLHVREHLKKIIHRETKAELEIMSFDPNALTGQKPVAVLIDELHVVAKMAKAPSAIRQLRGGMLPFPEAFMAFITTQSEEPPAGVFRSELIKARAIRDGKQQGYMLPVLYEFPAEVQKGKAWRDPALWHMVTPNAGRSISIDRLQQDMKTAEQTSEEELRAWASQHLDVEIGLALAADHWVGAEHWEKQARGPDRTPEQIAKTPTITLEHVLESSEVICVGIDGGGLEDMLGLVVSGRHKITREWMVWAHAWVHDSVLERRKSEAVEFREMEAAGDLTIFSVMGSDLEDLAEIVGGCEASGKLSQVGVDPAGLGGILDALVSAGVPKDKVIGISQGWKMIGAIKTAERKLVEGVLVHGGQRLMTYCLQNARTVPVGNSIVITKQASGMGKIDALLAMLDAITLLSLNPEAPKKKLLRLFTAG